MRGAYPPDRNSTIYQVSAKLQGAKSKCGKVTAESKKNVVTLKNLLNGTWDVSYKILFKKGAKKAGATGASSTSSAAVTLGKTKCPPKKKKKK